MRLKELRVIVLRAWFDLQLSAKCLYISELWSQAENHYILYKWYFLPCEIDSLSNKSLLTFDLMTIFRLFFTNDHCCSNKFYCCSNKFYKLERVFAWQRLRVHSQLQKFPIYTIIEVFESDPMTVGHACRSWRWKIVHIIIYRFEMKLPSFLFLIISFLACS